VPRLSAAQQQTVASKVDQLAATMHANSVLPLDQAYNRRPPSSPLSRDRAAENPPAT
jgi:hypothetical protein